MNKKGIREKEGPGGGSSHFINPFTDYGWKLIFGQEMNKDVIISFLNSLLEESIVDIRFRNVEALGMNHADRRAVFDIFCETSRGELVIVEMQKSHQKFFTDRVLYYASMAIQQQVAITKERLERLSEEEGKRQVWDYEIQRVYVVCILNYKMDRENRYPDKYRWDVVRMERELKVPFSNTLLEIYLEMPKFRLSLPECDTFYKKFLYVLNNMDIMLRLPEELNNQIFRKLKSIAEVERMTADERLAYELSLSVERDLLACMESKYEDGLAAGKAEGIAEGKAEGKAEATRLLIQNMKRSAGLDEVTIAGIVNLPVEEVARILEQ